jgi:hypothetical protein
VLHPSTASWGAGLALVIVFTMLWMGAVLARNHQNITGPIGGRSSGLIYGGPNLGVTGFFGSEGPPPVGCNAGQLDFSDVTGCNLALYMVGL